MKRPAGIKAKGAAMINCEHDRRGAGLGTAAGADAGKPGPALDVHLFALDVRNEDGTTERYVFIADDCERNLVELTRKAAMFSADPELSFSWPESIMLAKAVNKVLVSGTAA